MNRKNRITKTVISILIFTIILCTLSASVNIGLLPISEKSIVVSKSGQKGNYWKYNEQSNVFLVLNKSLPTDKTAKTFVSSLSAVAGKRFSLNSGNNIAESGNYDILLIADAKTGIEEEGYNIVVEGSQLFIKASDDNGLFYGCADVIKQLQKSGRVISVHSAPDTAERALFLDIARKYYTPSWIKKLIKELESARMNTLVFHFSEEMGLGLESKKYPWLNGRDGTLCIQCEVPTDNRQITQTEMADIVSYAKMHHVEIVPSFDTPGHMNHIVKQFNARAASSALSFTYLDKVYEAPAGTDIGNYYHTEGKTAVVQGTRNKKYSRGIDITNEYAIAFTKSLLDEYASFFSSLGCRKFNMGGDELLGWGASPNPSLPKWQQLDHWKKAAVEATGNNDAVAYDYFLLYMNDIYEMLTSPKYGYKSVRMWNDDAMRSYDTGWKKIVKLNTDIDIEYWQANKTNTYSLFTAEGHNIYNYLSYYNFYALMPDNYYPNCTPKDIYNNWNPFTFVGNENGGIADVGDKKIKGSALCVWCDEPDYKTEQEVFADIKPLVHVHGAKAWDTDCNLTKQFKSFIKELN